ncbi:MULTISPECIES: hypothetical protein [Natrinema]|uniref:Uncharacterized protein n=1 Tax=Natrinema gari JCM 14663 TaxID=1230459 RepID=L9ZC41_9EURY|nr:MULTISPECIES: hypothetical protein [Natrinema]AFO56271.1 hypothetical protein NJ7G_1024 [Natrinema sp. J7-2]ELY83192.1 hypothetical protein C486_02468 [Natrinema gari JCM 14663]
MSLDDLPIVGGFLEAGAEDRVFDLLLLVGPLLILFIAVAGRSPLTVGGAIAYCWFFIAHIIYRGVQKRV